MVTTLLEFAIVLFLKRKVERLNDKSKISALNYEVDYLNQLYQTPMKVGNSESKNASNPETIRSVGNSTRTRMSFDNIKNGVCNNTSLNTRIDIIVFWVFIFSYLTFNIFYWKTYPSYN